MFVPDVEKHGWNGFCFGVVQGPCVEDVRPMHTCKYSGTSVHTPCGHMFHCGSGVLFHVLHSAHIMHACCAFCDYDVKLYTLTSLANSKLQVSNPWPSFVVESLWAQAVSAQL
jgi:hypothetical protein